MDVRKPGEEIRVFDGFALRVFRVNKEDGGLVDLS